MAAPSRSETRALVLEEAAAWRFLHHLFRRASEDQWSWLQSGQARAAWHHLARALAGSHPLQLPVPDEFAEYEQMYLAAFEVGAPQPLCPLIESHWNRRDPVTRILHENAALFRRFGLRLRSAGNEPADHLRHQLEFLHYLAARVAEEPDSNVAGQYAQARADYVVRHLRAWVPRAAQAASRALPDSWPSHWMRVLADYVVQDDGAGQA